MNGLVFMKLILKNDITIILQKIKSYNFILLIALFLISHYSNGQENIDNNLIVKSKGGKEETYLYQNRIYFKHQLYEVLVQDAAATKLYNKYQTKKDNSNIGYCASGVLAIIYVGFAVKTTNNAGNDIEVAKAIVASIFSGAASLIVLSISAINSSAD